jgi:hypothetical protein
MSIVFQRRTIYPFFCLSTGRIRKRDIEPDERDRHADVVASSTRQQPRQAGEERAAALGVSAQPTDGERKDGREDVAPKDTAPGAAS